MSTLDTLDGLLKEAISCHHDLGMVQSLIRIAYLNGRTSALEEAIGTSEEVDIDNIQ